MATGVIDQAAHLIAGKENMYKPPAGCPRRNFSFRSTRSRQYSQPRRGVSRQA